MDVLCFFICFSFLDFVQLYWFLFEFLTADLFEYFVYPSMLTNSSRNGLWVPSYPPSSSEVTLPLWAGDPDPSPESQFPPPVAWVPTSAFSLCLHFLHPLQFLYSEYPVSPGR